LYFYNSYFYTNRLAERLHFDIHRRTISAALITLTANSRFKNPDAGSKYNGGGAGSMYYLHRRFVISLF
jgi:hypothetical protein